MAKLVVVVEDSEGSAALAIALESLSDTNVRFFANGRDAISFLQQPTANPDAIVTDLHLPYMDGFELVARLRSDCRYAQLPIVVISGDSNPETPGRLRTLGVNAFFSKPYSPALVRNELEALLYAK